MAVEKIHVAVPADLLEFANALVAGGDFASLDEVIVQALYLFRPVVEAERREEEGLKVEIQEGIEAADRGDRVDGPTFMRDLIARSRKPTGQAT